MGASNGHERLLGWVSTRFEDGDAAGLDCVRGAVGVAIGVLTSLGDEYPDLELLVRAVDAGALEELSFGSLTLANALLTAMADEMGTSRASVLQALAIGLAEGEGP